MNETLAVRDGNTAIGEALSPHQLLQQVNLIQEVMRAAMRDGEHYGTIPGCGDKKTLLKPGAEKLCLTFRLRPELLETITDLPGGHREYRVRCSLFSIITGNPVGQGLGSCSTMESKYRFRVAPKKLTDDPVPKAYWDLRAKDPKRAQELLGGPGFSAKKNDAGQWMIAEGSNERVEHDNPADYYNTVLKMAKKRALVDACLTATAASDCFTQDVEDIQENLKANRGETVIDVQPEPQRPATAQPAPRQAQPASQTLVDGDWRNHVLHFGKNKGATLGELPEPSLNWYREKWEPKEYPPGSGKFSEADKELRFALDASMSNQPSPAAAQEEQGQVPF